MSLGDGKAWAVAPGLARWRPRSLRAQLALWYAALLALTLILLAGFSYILLDQFLTRRADADLYQDAEMTAKQIAQMLREDSVHYPGRVPDTAAFITNNTQSWGRYVQVIDPRGNVVAASDALRTVKFPRLDSALVSGLQGVRATFTTVAELGESPVRIVTVPVELGAQIPYLVQEGASVEGVEAALQRASEILFLLTPSVFLVALLGGWALVGRALRPVDEMTQTALSIESRRLDRRLVPPRSDNEIGRLAGAFNEMIARLDKSFRQIERFSADASHELKTPLTSIRGEAEVALMGDLTPDEYRNTLRSIVEETERMSSIVNNLLLLARADADQVRIQHNPVPLAETVMAAYESLEAMARKKQIALDIEQLDEVTVSGDALWLQQLVTNLLLNAIKYTPEEGAVFLSLTREPVADAAGGSHAVLRVRDTGPGIAPEHLPHLFDRFYRVDSGRSRDAGGSGLGLNIARWVAESHGGTIAVESNVGIGSTFKVTLPAAE